MIINYNMILIKKKIRNLQQQAKNIINKINLNKNKNMKLNLIILDSM